MKATWTSNASTAIRVAAIALMAVTCAISEISTLRTKQQIQLIAKEDSIPDLLPRYAQSFQLGMRVRFPGFPADEMTHSVEWEELNRHLKGYAARLKLMDEQSRELDARLAREIRWTTFGTLGAILLLLVLARREKVGGRGSAGEITASEPVE